MSALITGQLCNALKLNLVKDLTKGVCFNYYQWMSETKTNSVKYLTQSLWFIHW